MLKNVKLKYGAQFRLLNKTKLIYNIIERQSDL